MVSVDHFRRSSLRTAERVERCAVWIGRRLACDFHAKGAEVSGYIKYYPGGFMPSAPAQNMAERLDIASGFQRWDSDGNLTEARPLTPGEIAALTPQSIAPTTDERLAAAAMALAALDNITAPVLPVDVIEILSDVRNALGG